MTNPVKTPGGGRGGGPVDGEELHPSPPATARLFAVEIARVTPRAAVDGVPVSPTGAPCLRNFTVGLLTSVEKRGAEHRGSVADLTGEVRLEASANEPAPALFLGNAETPALVAATVRWTPGGLRAEEIHRSTESARSRWVVETANRTLDRVERMRAFLASRGRGFPEAEARRLRAAAENYRLTHSALDEMEEEAAAAIRIVSGGPDPEKTLLELLGRPGSEGGLAREGLLREAAKAGTPRGAAERALDSLLAEGRCFEPKEGMIRRVA
ncbi:MAG: hypothetical protein QXQ87_00805 [Halobacteria archaeon]